MPPEKVIRMLRLKLGLSQTELAKILGVRQTTISAYEIGTIEPSFQMIKKIVHLAKKNRIKLNLEDFLNGEVE